MDLHRGMRFLIEGILSKLYDNIIRMMEVEMKPDFEKELCRKLQEIQKQVEAKRCEIVTKLKDHENNTKQKIYDHTKPLMAELYSFYHVPDPEARILKTKIKSLIEPSGKLKQLQSFVGNISTTLVHYRELGRILKDRRAQYTQESMDQIRNLLGEIKLLHNNEHLYRNHIVNVINRLEKIFRILDDESLINDILYNIGYLSKDEIGQYSSKVNSDIASLGRFKAIFQELGVMSSPVDSAEKANSSVQRAKEFVNKQCNFLNEGLVSIFSRVETFHVGELYAIKSSIEAMKPSIHKISTYLSNTENLLGYLELVTSYRTRLESLKIEEPQTPYADVLLSKAKELMSELSDAQEKITGKAMEIRKTLERIVRNSYAHSRYIKRYSPEIISLGSGVMSEIGQCETRLEKIVGFTDLLHAIGSGLNFETIKRETSQMRDVDTALVFLGSVYSQLGLIYSTISGSVRAPESNYLTNKKQIYGNGLSGGRNDIGSHMDLLGGILKLQSFVRWSIVCLGIVDYINSLVDNFLKCSIKYIISTLESSTKSLAFESANGLCYSKKISISSKKNLLENTGGSYGSIWTILSHKALIESKFVLSRLYECSKMVDDVLIVLNRVENCNCVSLYKSSQKPPYYHHVLFAFSHEVVHQHLHSGKLSESEISYDGNHLCLCLVIKFYLYPTLVKCLCLLIDTDLDILSTMSRKFEKYTKADTFYFDSSKLIIHIIDLIVKITYWIRESNRWKRCFCTKPDDVYYKYFISTMIYISFIVENMFRADCKGVEECTRHMTTLLSDIDIIDLNCAKISSTTQNGGKARHSQNSTCATLKYRKHSPGGMYYIMVRRTKHPVRSKLPFRWLSLSRRKNEHLIAYKLILGVRCEPFEEDNFGIEAAFPFVNIEKIKEEAERLSKSGCVSSGIVKNGNELEPVKCHTCMIVGFCLNMVRKDFDLIKMQISGNSILYMVLEPEYSSNGSRMRQIVKTISEEGRKITIMSRNNRIVDSTNVITNNKLEGSSHNNYTYNDAYRINSSRTRRLFLQ